MLARKVQCTVDDEFHSIGTPIIILNKASRISIENHVLWGIKGILWPDCLE
jgi:hypothetical protein